MDKSTPRVRRNSGGRKQTSTGRNSSGEKRTHKKGGYHKQSSQKNRSQKIDALRVIPIGDVKKSDET